MAYFAIMKVIKRRNKYSNNMNTTTKIVLTVIVIALVVCAFWFWGRGGVPTSAPSGAKGSGLGSDLYNKAAPNPAQNLPETNPFKAETNPFKGAQTNPFGQ